jgi:hypothetical protein
MTTCALDGCLSWLHIDLVLVLVQVLIKPKLISPFSPAVVAGPGLQLLVGIEGR